MAITCLDQAHGDNYAMYNGDCVELLTQMPAHRADFCVYSPPFSNLFVYSKSPLDMGNSVDDAEFFQHYDFLLQQLTRVIKPGREIAVHCSDLPFHKWKDGYIGVKDFSGMLIRAHEAQGQILSCRITVWKSPVVEQQRTKAIGLLYKQLRKDSSMSRTGMPDYVLIFRMPGENAVPIVHTFDNFPLSQWQEWASPVWMTINQSNTLNKDGAREENDERHIAPLQLDLIERCITLYSNPNEVVLSPFAGIGSEGYVSLQLERRFIGIELKPSYFKQAASNLRSVGRLNTKGFFGQ
jgi:hypothetical protein